MVWARCMAPERGCVAAAVPCAAAEVRRRTVNVGHEDHFVHLGAANAPLASARFRQASRSLLLCAPTSDAFLVLKPRTMHAGFSRCRSLARTSSSVTRSPELCRMCAISAAPTYLQQARSRGRRRSIGLPGPSTASLLPSPAGRVQRPSSRGQVGGYKPTSTAV